MCKSSYCKFQFYSNQRFIFGLDYPISIIPLPHVYVKPKIGNMEKHQGKYGKHTKELGKQYVKLEEMYGEMGGKM